MGKFLKWLTGSCLTTSAMGCLTLVILVSVVIAAIYAFFAWIIAVLTLLFGGGQSATIPASIHGMPTTGSITATFHDTNYFQQFGVQHEGVDIANSEGTPVYCTVDNGSVVMAGWDTSGYGYFVKVSDDASGYTVIYAHLRDMPAVSVGDAVTHGQYLGPMGETGNSTGVHLHYEIRNASGTPVDPAGSAGCCGYSEQ